MQEDSRFGCDIKATNKPKQLGQASRPIPCVFDRKIQHGGMTLGHHDTHDHDRLLSMLD
jgi:hypothetical protein